MRRLGIVGSREKAGSVKKIHILLVEDNRLLRDGIKALINAQPDLKIAATSEGNQDVLIKARTLNPQVILMDMGLRNENGVHVVATLTKILPQIKVIGMGLVPSQLDIVELVQAGAVGFILKDATIDNVLSTIRSVARGEKVLPPLLTGSLFSHVVEHALPRGGEKGELADAVRMTKREREIIVLIAEAMSNKEIANRLNLSTYTVKSHIHNILEKMALHSRLEIATHSYENKGL
jgi:DNA-binding NarL/FixJ family response regulator